MPTLFRFLMVMFIIEGIAVSLFLVLKQPSNNNNGYYTAPNCQQEEVAVRNYNNSGTVCVLRGKGG